MTVGAIVQARMGSTRLPGKALADIEGVPMLARVIERVRRAQTIDRVIVATTTQAADDAIVGAAETLGVDVYRGDEADVLDRYYQAAIAHRFEIIVRITSDCPLIDAGLADEVVRPLLGPGSPVDYSANTVRRTYPRGLDVQAAPLRTIERAWREARTSHEREHVFPYVYEHPELFRFFSVSDSVDRSDRRWTVDTADDLAFVRKVYRALGAADFTWRDVLKVDVPS
jgi:spore coat polysaccharide biosynthesis protein SpsF